jgi:hypothetical protein
MRYDEPRLMWTELINCSQGLLGALSPLSLSEALSLCLSLCLSLSQAPSLSVALSLSPSLSRETRTLMRGSPDVTV